MDLITRLRFIALIITAAYSICFINAINVDHRMPIINPIFMYSKRVTVTSVAGFPIPTDLTALSRSNSIIAILWILLVFLCYSNKLSVWFKLVLCRLLRICSIRLLSTFKLLRLFWISFLILKLWSSEAANLTTNLTINLKINFLKKKNLERFTLTSWNCFTNMEYFGQHCSVGVTSIMIRECLKYHC